VKGLRRSKACRQVSVVAQPTNQRRSHGRFAKCDQELLEVRVRGLGISCEVSLGVPDAPEDFEMGRLRHEATQGCAARFSGAAKIVHHGDEHLGELGWWQVTLLK
jgi:hypothetical protein